MGFNNTQYVPAGGRMNQALAIMTTATMHYFTGVVPSQVTEQTYDHIDITPQIERYVSPEIRIVIGDTALVLTALYERRIVYEVRF